jgi:hypothetical protein
LCSRCLASVRELKFSRAKTLCIGIGEDAENLLTVEEDIWMYCAEFESEAVFSPIPTIRHMEQLVVDRWDKSSCGAFHNSTALITTTSFILSGND